MNKNAIQKFAIWARNELIAQVSQRAYQYGIDESGFGDASADTLNGRLLTAEEKSQRQELIKKIKEKGYKQVMEEVAYTWFNRFIALRFMEVNNYLPSHIRVFSDASGAFKPEILNDVLHLDLPGLDSGKVAEYIESNDTEALYRYLLLTQCNALNSALPVMFERMGGYTEMLLPNNILRQDSVLGHMVSDIPEEDWQDAVQIIGWLYQYYNTELKDDTFAQLKKNVKITKERIPAATQLFTPDWIVRYMVENSLGRLWLEGHPNAELHDGWKYYLDEAEQEPEVEVQLAKLREEYKTIKPEEIKVIDPCMGSGHILVYAFDVLMQIYTSAGWDQREAAQSILKNNLFGLDIDDRAAQLAYFAVMMKARQYDRRLLTRGIQPHIYAFAESNPITTAPLHDMGITLSQDEYDTAVKQVLRLLDELRDAKEYGSILTVTPCDWDLLRRFAVPRTEDEGGQQLLGIHGEQIAAPLLQRLINIGEALSQQYDVVVTNPPYMAVSNAGAKVNDYVKKNFPDSKADMFAVFIERCGQMAKKNGYQAMITQPSFLSLTSFENLRKKVLANNLIENLLHMGRGIFGIDFGSAAFILRNTYFPSYSGAYFRLHERTFQYIDPNDISTLLLKAKEDHSFKYSFAQYDTNGGIINQQSSVHSKQIYFESYQDNFSRIPGAPFAYWLTAKVFDLYARGITMENIAHPKVGMQTSNNEKFLRLWYEVNYTEFRGSSDGMKWIKYLKGGAYRKWYGNLEYVLFYNRNPKFILQQEHARVLDISFLHLKKCTWTDLASSGNSFRLPPDDSFYDISGHCFFPDESDQLWLLAYSNTNFFAMMKQVFNSTFHCQVGDVAKIVVPPLTAFQKQEVTALAKVNVDYSRVDWDAQETSWDFKRNPLV